MGTQYCVILYQECYISLHWVWLLLFDLLNDCVVRFLYWRLRLSWWRGIWFNLIWSCLMVASVESSCFDCRMLGLYMLHQILQRSIVLHAPLAIGFHITLGISAGSFQSLLYLPFVLWWQDGTVIEQIGAPYIGGPTLLLRRKVTFTSATHD